MTAPNQTIVLASGNAGKLREFQNMLSGCGFDVRAQSDYKVTEVPETGLTFVENAIIKARNACQQTGLASIADDSGIEVDALNGAPGIYSARFAGPNCIDADNNAKLVENLKGLPAEQRSARYHCILVFMQHELDPTPIIAQGSWEGMILEEPRGEGGFGYDPIFWVPSHHCSSAEMTKEIKNSISHRAKAMADLLLKIRASTALKSK